MTLNECWTLVAAVERAGLIIATSAALLAELLLGPAVRGTALLES